MATLSEGQEFFIRTLAETLSESRKGRFVVLRKMIEAGWNNRTNSIRPAIVAGSVTCITWSYHSYGSPEDAKWYRDYGCDIEVIWREVVGGSQLIPLVELCAKANEILAQRNVLSDEEFSGSAIQWVNVEEAIRDES